MLQVPTYVGQSLINGLGLFAAVTIPAGSVIWQFTDGLDIKKTPEEIEEMPVMVQTFFDHYGYFDKNICRWVLCVDDARFMNHSDNPTTEPCFTFHPQGIDIASVDIAVGTELTTDYRLYNAAGRP